MHNHALLFYSCPNQGLMPDKLHRTDAERHTKRYNTAVPSIGGLIQRSLVEVGSAL